MACMLLTLLPETKDSFMPWLRNVTWRLACRRPHGAPPILPGASGLLRCPSQKTSGATSSCRTCRRWLWTRGPRIAPPWTPSLPHTCLLLFITGLKSGVSPQKRPDTSWTGCLAQSLRDVSLVVGACLWPVSDISAVHSFGGD